MAHTRKVFILDVDGVLTTGQFLYSKNGKEFKIFGPDDNDALQLTKKYVDIVFISGDKKGFEISKKRIVDDMGFELHLVDVLNRNAWIGKNYNLQDVIYMGDGFFDNLVMEKVSYSIAPQNADELAKKSASFVTLRKGGERAVAEACVHLLDNVLKQEGWRNGRSD